MPEAETKGGPAPAARQEPAGHDRLGGAHRLRRWLDDVHRRTWELELLLSGAVVFALLKLPGRVDVVYERLDAGLGGTLETAAFFGWYYLKLILYTLIGAFLVHLVARAYWVGVVGLDAVFPRGPRFDRLEAGPLTQELYRRRLPSLKRQITVADRFSSAVFSFAFAVIVIFLLSIVYGLVLSGIALAISRLAFGGERFGDVFRVLMALVFAPLLLVPLVDKLFGKRLLARGGRPLAVFRRLVVIPYRATGAPLVGPILTTLVTNVNKKVYFTVFFVTFILLAGFFVVHDVLIARGALTVGSHRYVPADGGALGVDPRHYDDRRGEGEISFLPSIPGEVVEGPTLRLFVPLPVEWTEEAVAERCPGLAPIADPGLRLSRPRDPSPEAADLEPVLACLAGLHEIELDGEPAAPPFFFHTEPGSGVRGLLARLPIEGLAPGPHLLTVARLRLAEDERPPRRHHLRFWTVGSRPPGGG